MKSRRGFLTVLGAVSSAGIAVAMGAERNVSVADAADAAAKPRKAPSAAALALAVTFRSFDPHLSDAELQTIAHGIDDNRAAGPLFNPKSKPLRNSDEMVVRFAATETIRR